MPSASPLLGDSPFSNGEELTPSPRWDQEDDYDDDESPITASNTNNGYDTFEEVSESEERRRRVGEGEEQDYRYLDPELYGLRRSSRRAAPKSSAYAVCYFAVRPKLRARG